MEIKKTEEGAPEVSSLLSRTKELLRRYDLKAKKSLGQHFLINSGVLKRIISAAEIKGSDVVVEVGPGLGVLTRELAEAAGWVIAIELDDRLSQFLRGDLKPSANVTVISRDVLEVDPEALLKDVSSSIPAAFDPAGYKVVANLPYYITSAILRHFLTARKKPELMVIMVQKEVARQITAPPGGMSILSVSVQLYGKPRIVDYVTARSFYPPPEVDSAILQIRLHSNPIIPAADEDGFFEVVRAGFSSPRKQLVNSLSNGLKLPKEKAGKLLQEAGIAPQRRAETLTLEEWGRLLQSYRKEGAGC